MEVKDLIGTRPITQRKLAKEIGMNESVLSRKLSGEIEFSKRDLKKIFIQTRATNEEIVEVMLG